MSNYIEVDEDGFAGSLVYKKIEAIFSWYGAGGQIHYFDGEKCLGIDNISDADNWEDTARFTISYFSPTNDNPGYVYLLKASTGHYKIGRSKKVIDRLKLFEVKLPFEVEIIHLFPCVDMVDAERQLHIIFADKRVNGEWFDLSITDVATIKTIHAANEYREFCKVNGYGETRGMPELHKYLPDNYYIKYPH